MAYHATLAMTELHSNLWRVRIAIMKTIAVANHKGGVGKTTTVANVAPILAEMGRRVLLVDMDPQGGLTQTLGVDAPEGHTMTAVMGTTSPGRAKLREIIQPVPPWEGLFIAPADLDLAATELGLTTRLGRENVLKKALASTAGFDVCLIDCPPSLGLLTVNALVAADAVLIPTLPQTVDLRALVRFLETVDQVKEALNPDLAIFGILITSLDNRLRLHRDAIEAMRRAGLPLLDATIARSIRAAEAADAQQPLLSYEPNHPLTKDYRRLAEEIDTWLRNAE